MSAPPEALARDGAVARVAYAIAKVIAARAVEEDAKLRTLDGLGKAAAIHDMSRNMSVELRAEAAAAFAESQKIIAEESL